MAAPNLNNQSNGRIHYIPNGQRFLRPQSGQVYRPVNVATSGTPQDAQKCQNFLDTLVRLADNRGEEVGIQVRDLVTQLLNDELQPERFGSLISSTVIGSRPQPGLVPFLQKNLPCLRKYRSVSNGAVRINSIPNVSSAVKTEIAPSLPSGYSGRLPGEGIRPIHNVSVSQPITSVSSSGHQYLIGSQMKLLKTSPLDAVPSSSQPSHDISSNQNFYRAQTPSQTSPAVYLSTQLNNGIRRRPMQGKVYPVARNISPRPSSNSNLAIKDEEPEDLNDVTSQTGINLTEEADFLAEDNLVPINQLPRAPGQTYFVTSINLLNSKIKSTAAKYQLEDQVSPVVGHIVATSCQKYLKDLITKIGAAAQHRSEILRQESRYEIESEIKPQLKFFNEIEIAELQRKKELERENLVRTAKSRSKNEDPDEQQKAKRKVKEMELASAERQTASQTNAAAIHALDDTGGMPAKKRLLMSQGDPSSHLSDSRLSGLPCSANDPGGSTDSWLKSMENRARKPTLTPRRVVTLKDAVMVLESEKNIRSDLLYSAMLKL